jgi:hypothetical protein
LRYNSGYVSYLAAYAASLYDYGDLVQTPALTPPLYDRAPLGGTGLTLSTGDGDQAMVALIPGGNNAPARAGMVRSSRGASSGGIGRSGYANWDAFARALEGVYQRAYEDAHTRWQNMTPRERRESSGRPWNMLEGTYADRESRRVARAFVRAEGLREGSGEMIRINRVLRNPANWLQRVQPDLHVRGTYLGDGSLSDKTLDGRGGQVRNAMEWSGLNTFTVIRSGARGGSYTLIGPGYTGAQPPRISPPVAPRPARARR